MRTIRRLYLYGVSFVSLMVVTWGLIGLARSAISGTSVQGDVSRLAGALALIFVGVPVFLLHWWLAQRSTREDEEERFSRIRAIFLYGALLSTLMPIILNILALVNRIFSNWFEIPNYQVLFGYRQTLSDNLVAIVMNALIAVYLFWVLRQNWATEDGHAAFRETRRVYRLFWEVYSLLLVFVGAQQALLYLGRLLADNYHSQTMLANGLTMFLVGIPLWIFSWRVNQKALSQPDEGQSLLRLIVRYAVRLISLVAVLFGLGGTLEAGIRALLNPPLIFTDFMSAIQDLFSIAVPMGIIWVFYHIIVRRENRAYPDDTQREGIHRFYTYILALLGLIAAFWGFHKLIYALIDLLPLDDFASQDPIRWARLFRRELAEAFAMLIVGLPVWLLHWIPIQRAATSADETGDLLRRSMIRRGYLYLVLFGGVIGVMARAGLLIFHLLQAALGEPASDLVVVLIKLVSGLALFGLLLWYHWRWVQTDGQRSSQTLAERHADFPVLILASKIGAFSEQIVAALQKEAPLLPVAIHIVDQGVPDETLSNAKAVILPAQISAYPQEAIRLWIQNFPGVRFVIPTPVQGWVWVSGNGTSQEGLIRQTAAMVRKLAEGEALTKPRSTVWTIIGAIFGGVVGLILLIFVLSILAETLL